MISSFDYIDFVLMITVNVGLCWRHSAPILLSDQQVSAILDLILREIMWKMHKVKTTLCFWKQKFVSRNNNILYGISL